MDDRDNQDAIRKYNSLIRHVFPSVEIEKLSDDDWALMAKDAQWMFEIMTKNKA